MFHSDEEGATGSVLPGLAAFDANAIIPGMDLPVTAGNVVLPQSNDVDEDIDLYGDSGKSKSLHNKTWHRTLPVTGRCQRWVFEGGNGKEGEERKKLKGKES